MGDKVNQCQQSYVLLVELIMKMDCVDAYVVHHLHYQQQSAINYLKENVPVVV